MSYGGIGQMDKKSNFKKFCNSSVIKNFPIMWILMFFIYFRDSTIALIIYTSLVCILIALVIGELLYIRIFKDYEKIKTSLLYWQIIRLFIEAITFITVLEVKGHPYIAATEAIAALLILALLYTKRNENKAKGVVLWGYTLNLPQ